MSNTVPEQRYTIYCDGAAAPTNPGPSSYGVVLMDQSTDSVILELSGFLGHGTNQTAELNAAIIGLQSVPISSFVTLISDSQYVLKGLTEWRKGWEARGWCNAAKKPIANKEFWFQLFREYDQRKVTCEWVRGHTGVPGNERADFLATKVLVDKGLIKDELDQPGSRPMPSSGAPGYLV